MIGVLALALLAVVILQGAVCSEKNDDPALNAKGKAVEETVSKEQERPRRKRKKRRQL